MNIFDIKNFESRDFRPNLKKNGFLWINTILTKNKILKINF